MVYRILLKAALVATVLASAACGGTPKPDTADDANTDAQVKPPPPPPPKCEALDEKCSAKEDTLAKVKTANLLFTPGKDWIYAQGEKHTLAQVSEEGAALALGSYTPDKDAKKDAAARDEAFGEIVKALGATAPKNMKINWKKPDAPEDVNGFKLGVWQVQGAERGKKKGILLVVQGSLDDEHALIGAGFAEETDQAGMEAISNSIKSIKADSKKSDEKKDDKATDDKKAEDGKKADGAK